MKCPYCGNFEDKVIDSRMGQDGQSIRRRRECLDCIRRFTTYEVIEKPSMMVIKRDSSRQPFERSKIKHGIIIACQKRPIKTEVIESIVDQIEQEVQTRYDKELKTSEIGELILKKLKDLDVVAYVRFASVYKQFVDVQEFTHELKKFM